MLKLSLCVVAVAQLLGSAEGHGRVTEPPARIEECRPGGRNSGCRNTAENSIQNNGKFPTSPFGSMDGLIASAMMAGYRELDEQGPDRWYKSPFKSGRQSFTWELSAPHPTADFRYFITKNGWNPSGPLRVISFDPKPFCSVTLGRTPPKRVTHECNVPQRDGYHIILAEWQISDSGRSFYSVIDLDFNGGGGGGSGPATFGLQPLTRYHNRNTEGHGPGTSKWTGKGLLCIGQRDIKGCKRNVDQNVLRWNGNDDNNGPPASTPRPPVYTPRPPAYTPRPPTNNGPGVTKSLSPIHDAYVEGGAGMNTAELKVEYNRRVTYLMFDLGGDSIESAELTMTVRADAGSGALTVAKGGSNGWTERALSSGNAPSAADTLATVGGSHVVGEELTWQLPVNKLGNGKVTLIVRMEARGNDVDFHSKESRAGPVLKIRTAGGGGGGGRPPVSTPRPPVYTPRQTPRPSPPRPSTPQGCSRRVPKWGNCHKSKNCCASGSRCVRKNRWYSQCL